MRNGTRERRVDRKDKRERVDSEMRAKDGIVVSLSPSPRVSEVAFSPVVMGEELLSGGPNIGVAPQ